MARNPLAPSVLIWAPGNCILSLTNQNTWISNADIYPVTHYYTLLHYSLKVVAEYLEIAVEQTTLVLISRL